MGQCKKNKNVLYIKVNKLNTPSKLKTKNTTNHFLILYLETLIIKSNLDDKPAKSS